MTSIFVDMDDVQEYEALNEQYNEIHAKILQKAIDGFKGAAMEFARVAIHEVGVRHKYIAGIQKMSEKILGAVNDKSITVHEGARIASELRNSILVEHRFFSTKIGRTYAEKIKGIGPTVEALTEKKSLKLLNKGFSQLTPSERRTVYFEIIKSSGRDNPKITSLLPALQIAAAICILITIGLAIYNTAEAEDRGQEGTRQAAKLGGGFAGGTLGGYAGASLAAGCTLLGPGMVLVLALLGGIVGGWLGSEVATQVLESGEEYSEKLYEIEELEDFLSWEIF